MKINNQIEFYHFMSSHGLMNLSPEIGSLGRCIEEFGRMCNCDPPAARNAKMNQCRAIYVNFIHGSGKYKDILLSKIADNYLILAVDNQSVVTLNR